VAGYADHEGFTSPFRHELGPHGLCRSGLAEVGEFADVVNNGIVRLLADLTFSREQPKWQLFAGVADPFRDAVVEDRFLLPLQWYPAEPCDQWFPAVAFDDNVEARAQAVRCFDLGSVFRRHLSYGRAVFAR